MLFQLMTGDFTMTDTNNFLLNLSVLYRNVQKYFDKVLARYEIGSGQVIILMYINEHAGTTMQDVSRVSEVDKGTTTKSVNRLIDQGYVQVRQDENDRRVKPLYTTEKAAEIMNSVYEYRNACRNTLAEGMDFDAFEKGLQEACDNSRTQFNMEEEFEGLRIGGLQKMTLLDYPGKVACTIFMAGCGFKCPFCHNRDLVYIPEDYTFFDLEEVLQYLEKRKGILDGVCISGGEPLMQNGLKPFIRKVRSFGYQIKLDTNGDRPDKLKELCDEGLVDYIAMDIKNGPEKYARTVAMDPSTFTLDKIQESIDYLKKGNVPFEFRTTVVKELHTQEDLLQIAEWIGPVEHYYLQQFKDSGHLICPGFSAYSYREMQELLEQVQKIIPQTELRGVKEG